MEWGLARHVLEKLAPQANSLVLLPEAPLIDDATNGSLSGQLRTLVLQRSANADKKTRIHQLDGEALDANIVDTNQLTANDLPIYQQYLSKQRQRQQTGTEKGATTLETSADALDEGSEGSSSSDDDSDAEHQGKSMNVSAVLTSSKSKLDLTDEELGINILLRRKNVHDFDVRGKKGRDKVFPFVAKRRRQDDFGELIRPEDFLRAEERDDVEGQDMSADKTKNKAALGHKRKWGDQEPGQSDNKRRRQSLASSQKRKKADVSATRTNSAPTEGSENESSEEESDYEPADAVVRGPMRAVITKTSITLKTKITAVDFSGIHDQRSLQMLVPLIKPRRLILVGGSEQETASLLTTCKQLLTATAADSSISGSDIVFAPSAGETVDASVDTNAWTIKLSQDLYRKLQWQPIRSLGIVTLNGRLELVQQSNDELGDHDAKRQKTDSTNTATSAPSKSDALPMPVLSDLPVSTTGSIRTANNPIHVGDLRLAELRRIMQANGHIAEFKGEGTLLVDGLVAIRKSGVGKIEIEAGGFAVPGTSSSRMPGTSFSNVKKKIYEGLALVAAR